MELVGPSAISSKRKSEERIEGFELNIPGVG